MNELLSESVVLVLMSSEAVVGFARPKLNYLCDSWGLKGDGILFY